VDPWPQADTSYVEPTYVQGTAPHYVLVADPPPRRRRGLRVAVAIVGVFAACCAGGATLALLTSAAARDAFSFNNSADPVTDPTTVPAQAPPPPSPTPQPAAAPGLNTPVRDGKFEFVVSAVTCGQESVGINPLARQARGQYCLVELSVQNISTHDQLLLDGVQKAYDSTGAEYSPDTAAGLIANVGTQAWLNVLKPGVKVTGKFVYDVPDGTTLSKLVLHDSALSNGTTVTL
jgi:hypothetical protein